MSTAHFSKFGTFPEYRAFALCSPYVRLQFSVIITLDVTEFQIETILKALRNEADRDRAYRQMGVADTLSLVVDQIEAQAVAAVKKPVQHETTERKKLTGSR